MIGFIVLLLVIWLVLAVLGIILFVVTAIVGYIRRGGSRSKA
jgi:hypothetical protein